MSLRLRSIYSDDTCIDSLSPTGLNISCSDEPSAICKPSATASAIGLMFLMLTEMSEYSSASEVGVSVLRSA